MKSERLTAFRGWTGAKEGQAPTEPELDWASLLRKPADEVCCTPEDHAAVKQSLDVFMSNTEYRGYADGFVYGNHWCDSTLVFPSDSAPPESMRLKTAPPPSKK
jgi:hypothetical protein